MKEIIKKTNYKYRIVFVNGELVEVYEDESYQTKDGSKINKYVDSIHILYGKMPADPRHKGICYKKNNEYTWISEAVKACVGKHIYVTAKGVICFYDSDMLYSTINMQYQSITEIPKNNTIDSLYQEDDMDYIVLKNKSTGILTKYRLVTEFDFSEQSKCSVKISFRKVKVKDS